MMKKLTTVLLALCLLCTLAACGGGGGASDKAGSYVMESFGAGEELISGEELADYGIADMFSMTLKEDGTFELSLQGEDPVTGSWTDSKITPDDPDALGADIGWDGDKIAIEGDGLTLTLVKE